MPENRVLKYNEANVQRQKEVHKVHASATGKNKKAASKKGKGEKDSDSRASTPSKDLTKEAAQSSMVSSSTSGGSSASSSEDSKLNSSQGGTETPTTVPGTAASAGGDSGASAQPPPSSTPNPAASRRSTAKSASEKDEKTSDRQSVGGGGGAVESRKKRGNSRLDPSVESEDQFCSKVEVKIKIPDELKPWLVDDWDAVTKQHKLVELPAKTTVQEIIDGYVQYKKTGKSVPQAKEPQILEVTNGLIEYFNVTLGSQLLYKFERPQYAEILAQYPDKPMSSIYGAVHLLRLFIKLGTMLAFTALDEKTSSVLLVHIHDFLKYMVKNSSTLFNMKQFEYATPEYHRQTQF